jgi:hypothetical protein
VYNFSPVAVSNVRFLINQGATVNEIIAGPINPLSEVTYNFTQKVDYSALGAYTARVALLPDDYFNNSIEQLLMELMF